MSGFQNENKFQVASKHFRISMSPDYAHQSQHNRMSNWNLERGYDTNIRFDSYPYRVAGSGADGDKLRAWLELSAINLEYLCRGPIQGYTIVLHVPGEIPQVSKHFFLIPQLQEVSVAVKANIMKTPEDLRHYHHDRFDEFEFWFTALDEKASTISDVNVTSNQNASYDS